MSAQELGALGEACFMEGRTEAARDATLEALELSRQAGDTEDVAVWLGNLYEIDRYRGDGPGAARWAAEFAELCESLDQPQVARQWRRLAAVVAAEPLVRLVAEAHGEEYELDELPPGVPVRFRFRRNRLTLRVAQRLLEQGHTLAVEGRHADALDRYQQACTVDPYAPEPRERAGVALLHMGRYAEALEVYAEAERLAPGWLQVSSDAWLAGELAAGRLTAEVWEVLSRADQETPEELLALTEGPLETHATLAPLQLARAGAWEQLGQVDRARQAYRQAVEHAAEANLKTRALLGLALLEVEPERTRLLQAAAELDGHLLSGATARYLLAGGLTG